MAREWTLDVLTIAPHPDDAELGMGGILARLAAHGRRVGVLDLTRGEMGTNGDPEQRLREGEAAGTILGLCVRRNLGLPDRGLLGSAGVQPLVEALRALRPRVVCAPCADEPHPDHVAAWHLTVEACFSSGLRKHPGGEPWHVRALLQYAIDAWPRPTVAVEVGAFYAVKWRAVAAHTSQFGAGGVPTRLNDGTIEAQIRARDRFWGGHLGALHAEPFVVPAPVEIADLGILLAVDGT